MHRIVFVEMKTESDPNIFGEIWTIFMRYVEFPAHLFSYFCPNAFIQTHIIKKRAIIHTASFSAHARKSYYAYYRHAPSRAARRFSHFNAVHFAFIISRSFCKVNFPLIALSTLFASWIHLQKAFSLIFPSRIKSFFKTRIECLFKQTRLNTTACLWHRL